MKNKNDYISRAVREDRGPSGRPSGEPEFRQDGVCTRPPDANRMGAEGNRGEFNHKPRVLRDRDRIGRSERGIKTGVLADGHRGNRNFDRIYRINCNRMDRMGEFAHGHCGASPEMLRRCGSGLFGLGLRFGSVTGRCGHAPSPKLRPKPKILAPHRHIISVDALVLLCCARDERGPLQRGGCVARLAVWFSYAVGRGYLRTGTIEKNAHPYK